MENCAGLKTFLKTWKPIHLCWWFEKHGWAIPKYFIGGGSKPPVYASGNIDNATRNLGNTVNTPVTNWVKTNDFIVAIALEAQLAANITNTNCRLEWRNKTDGGTFAVFSSSGELRLGSTDLVEGNSLDSGEAICTPVNGVTYVAGSPNGGVEKETGSTFTVGDASTINQWSEFQISVDADNALNSKEYEFRVYDVDNSAALGPSLATITMAAGGTAHFASISDTVGITDALTNKRNIIKSITDTVGITDILTNARNIIKSVADTVGITETIVAARTIKKSISDTVGITDVLNAALKKMVSISDTVGITDTIATFIARFRSILDTVGITDVRTTTRNIIKSIVDTVGVTDIIVTTRTIKKSISDTVGITDVLTGAKFVLASIADTVGITDTIVTIRDIIKSITDTVGVTDTVLVKRNIIKSIADTVGVTDTLVAAKHVFATLSDEVGITDVITIARHIIRNILDTVGVTDVIAAILGAAGRILEYDVEVEMDTKDKEVSVVVESEIGVNIIIETRAT